jgi:hypothetical protein
LQQSLTALRQGCAGKMSDCVQPFYEDIRFLRTDEALRAAVQLYRSEPNNSDYALWRAIIESPNSELAAKLLSERILDPDFVVSERVFDQLAAMQLRERRPEAFEAEASALEYHEAAVSIAIALTRKFGESLVRKSAAARMTSVETYQRYAGMTDCNGERFIPEPELQGVLASVGVGVR